MATVAAGAPAEVVIHSYRDYPYHEAGDYQHKPAYVETRRPS